MLSQRSILNLVRRGVAARRFASTPRARSAYELVEPDAELLDLGVVQEQVTPVVFVGSPWMPNWTWKEHLQKAFGARGFTTLSVRPGFSSKLASLASMDDFVDELRAIVVKHKMAFPPFLVGHGFGAFLAQKYVESHPAVGMALIAPLEPHRLASLPHLNMQKYGPDSLTNVTDMRAWCASRRWTHSVVADVDDEAERRAKELWISLHSGLASHETGVRSTEQDLQDQYDQLPSPPSTTAELDILQGEQQAKWRLELIDRLATDAEQVLKNKLSSRDLIKTTNNLSDTSSSLSSSPSSLSASHSSHAPDASSRELTDALFSSVANQLPVIETDKIIEDAQRDPPRFESDSMMPIFILAHAGDKIVPIEDSLRVIARYGGASADVNISQLSENILGGGSNSVMQLKAWQQLVTNGSINGNRTSAHLWTGSHLAIAHPKHSDLIANTLFRFMHQHHI